jgi:ribosomal protein S12 methylthiotransferase
VEVLIEEPLGGGRYSGRAAHQAPEVDGTTEVCSGGELTAGQMVRATVTGAEGADLLADVASLAGAPLARGAERGEPG